MADQQPDARTRKLEAMFEGFNDHDADKAVADMTENVVFDTVAGESAHGTRIEGRGKVRDAFAAVWAGMPDARWDVSDHSVVGDLGVSQWTFSGTGKDGMRVEAEGVDLFTFEGDKVARKRAFRKQRPPFKA